jgi:1-acyl-sn-glycerol-3-phosphate acyltransferase
MEESSDRRFAARLAPLVPGKETPHASASVAAKLARVFLTRLGIPKLWREDPEVLWPYARLLVSPTTLWLAPSYGYGLERVPPTGGGVVAVNHLSAIDPPLVGSLSPRTIYYMAKVELLSMPIVGDILMWTGAFPVRRGEGDRESLRQAREIARAGHMVGVFVEGTRQRFGYPGEILPGAMMIALQEGVPIVPCGVYSFGWSPKKRMPCAVVWGDPIDVTGLPRSGRGYKSAAGIVGAEILRLWRLAGAAIAAGFPSELPDGSRRTEARYLPVREGSTPSPSTSVKKAAA